ncbi:MAG: Holliday junction branch migration protein RuvA [Bergeyella sp.]|nr:Holliday junction branch migration protein RuvA [Bergeyella sp.]
MIYFLRGKVYELSPIYAIIEVLGVGYYVGLSLQTFRSLRQGEEVFLYTKQIFREDTHLLFGFSTSVERDLFNLLISVNGVGPSSALIMLSSLSNEEICSAIRSDNALLLQKVKGIGTKTAERIIIDLRDKVVNFGNNDVQSSGVQYNKIKREALSALEVLGIQKRVSEKIADKIIKQNPQTDVEELIKQILKDI